MKNKKYKFIVQIIRIFFILIFIACICYIGFCYVSAYIEQEDTSQLLNSIELDDQIIQEAKNEIKNENTAKDTTEDKDTSVERIAKVKKLKKQNSDIIGWIEIEDTKINYPVMQGKDNDFYMNHNYKKQASQRGSLFLHKDYNWNIKSNNFLIYGHNNTIDGSMFADLLKYQKESFYKEHPTIRFTTNKEDAKYEIIGVFRSRVYYKSETNVFRYYKFINVKSKERYNNFVKNVKAKSLYNTGKTAKYGDQLMTLSTCAYHTENGRFVVVARNKK